MDIYKLIYIFFLFTMLRKKKKKNKTTTKEKKKKKKKELIVQKEGFNRTTPQQREKICLEGSLDEEVQD